MTHLEMRNIYNMTNDEIKQTIQQEEQPGIEATIKCCEHYNLTYELHNTEARAYDLYIANPKTNCKAICEVKTRIGAAKYDTLLMEVDKCKRLLKWKDKNNFSKAFYINYITDENKLYLFEIDDNTLNTHPIVKMWCNEATYRHDNKKVQKDVIFLPKGEATKIYDLSK